MTNTITIAPEEGFSASDVLATFWAKSNPVGDWWLETVLEDSPTGTLDQLKYPSKSSAISLLKHARGWASDDMLEIVELVTNSREQSRF